jgi:hypothetical protein
MDNRFEVTVGAGTMMADFGAAARFPHWWTPGDVTVEADFTGGHLLHLAVAGCVLNDLYREAAELGIELKGVRVIAAGGFDAATWRSTASIRKCGRTFPWRRFVKQRTSRLHRKATAKASWLFARSAEEEDGRVPCVAVRRAGGYACPGTLLMSSGTWLSWS